MQGWQTFWYIAQAICLFFGGIGVQAQDKNHKDTQELRTKPRVAVLDFDSPALSAATPAVVTGASSENVGIGVSEKLIERLLKGGKYTLIDRSAVENLLNEVNDEDREKLGPYGLAARIGCQLGLDALIIGAVTWYGPDKKLVGEDSGRLRRGIHKQKSKAFVEITARVFSVSSGEIIAEFKGEGESTHSGDVLTIRSKANPDIQQEVLGSEFVDSLLNEATANALAEIAEKLNLFAEKIPRHEGTQRAPLGFWSSTENRD